MTPQEFYDKVTEIKKEIKNLYEELNEVNSEFAKNNLRKEFPIVDKNGKNKFVRIYEPEGRFVYNTKYELGLRADKH